MFRYLILFLIILTTWFLLSGFFKPLFIFFGVASSLISVYFVIRMEKVSGFQIDHKKPYYLSFSFLKYSAWLIKEIVISTFKLATEIWREKPQISPVTFWLKHDLKSEEAVTIYANSITLTPGTVSVTAGDDEILVHAIQQEGKADLESGLMKNKVAEVIKNAD